MSKFRYNSPVISLVSQLTLITLIVFEFLDEKFIVDQVEEDGGVIQFDFGFILKFLIFLAFSTLLFYIIIVKYKKYGMRILYTITLLIIYLAILSELLFNTLHTNSQVELYIWVILFSSSILFTFNFIIIFARGRNRISTRNIGILLASVGAGRLIALSLDIITMIAIFTILIFYDIWNVFKGPLKRLLGKPNRIIRENPTENKLNEGIDIITAQVCYQGIPVHISTRTGLMTGMGDLLIFSIILYYGLSNWGFFGLAITFAGITSGIKMTHYLLQRLSPLPGLPLPLSITLLMYGFYRLIIFFG